MNTLIFKWERIKSGERVVMSDTELDRLMAHFSPQETKEAGLYFRHLATLPNPLRMGTKDTYLAFLKTGTNVEIRDLVNETLERR